MSTSRQPANDAELQSENPEDDPEIAALLDFEPVPRHPNQPNAWTPEKQRRFIARLAVHGSKSQACTDVGKNRTGIASVYDHPHGASFRAAWHGALDLYERRQAEQVPEGPPPLAKPPTVDRRRKRLPVAAGPRPGQMLNEYGEWEDEELIAQRAEDARASICGKLLNARRLYLQEISDSPGKRAAFEILTELPIDWDKAARLEPQDDERWARTNQRQPDMILTAESGWSFGEMGYGPDKKAEMRRAIDEHRAEEGLSPVDWEGGKEADDE